MKIPIDVKWSEDRDILRVKHLLYLYEAAVAPAVQKWEMIYKRKNFAR